MVKRLAVLLSNPDVDRREVVSKYARIVDFGKRTKQSKKQLMETCDIDKVFERMKQRVNTGLSIKQQWKLADFSGPCLAKIRPVVFYQWESARSGPGGSLHGMYNDMKSKICEVRVVAISTTKDKQCEQNQLGRWRNIVVIMHMLKVDFTTPCPLVYATPPFYNFMDPPKEGLSGWMEQTISERVSLQCRESNGDFLFCSRESRFQLFLSARFVLADKVMQMHLPYDIRKLIADYFY